MKIKLLLMCLVSVMSIISRSAITKNHTELPLLISVCAYNNAPWVEMNLDSIFMQQYDNFHVVYIDDASSDDTALLVQNYIDTHQLHDKLTLQVNQVRCRKTKNIYNMFHTCDDQDIIVQVDGDDWLAHDQVFSRINDTYQNQDVWLTYGQFIGHDGSKEGMCKNVTEKVIADRSFRSWGWVYTHLRTFKAWLFKNIKLEDFINEQVPGFEGSFFPLSDDLLSYYPMLEMCGNKFAFIPDILYIYNRGNPLYTWKVASHLYGPANKEIHSKPKYPQVHSPIINRLADYEHAQADLIILSENNPKKLRAFLRSLSIKVSGINQINVLYTESGKKENQQYKELVKTYPLVNFITLNDQPINQLLLTLLQSTNQKHIVLANTHSHPLSVFNITNCIKELERTFAYGFYLGFAHDALPFYSAELDTVLVPHEHVTHDIYTWKFKFDSNKLYNNLDMTLLRTKTLLERILLMPDCSSLPTFMDQWQQTPCQDTHNVSLFYKTTKLKQKLPTEGANVHKI